MNNVHAVWDKVEKRGNKECWPWIGYLSSGYGRLDINGEQGVYAHRAAFISKNPHLKLPLKDDGSKDRCVLHKCDNPKCCNPKHLFLGSHAENMADKTSKGRQARFKSTEAPRAKLTAEDVSWMRIQKKNGATKKALAMLYEVSEATVSGALYGRHYRDVS